MKGVIKHYSSKNGYGFIAVPHGDIFFHYKALENRNAVKAGMNVTFDLSETERGLQASHIVAV